MTILLCILMIASNLVFSQAIVKATGVAVGVWQQSGVTWHYLNPNGTMITGWISSGRKWYYIKANGVMATGWISIDNKWYYLNSSGAMITGWIFSNGGKWYYLNSSGTMASSKWVKSGIAWYYLNAGGDMAVNIITPDGYKVDINGVWILAPPSVVPVTGVTLNKIKDDLLKGGTVNLVDTVSPTNANNKAVTWTSSDNAIVTVNNIGKVTAVDVGAATITVTSIDGGKTSICVVNVTKQATTVTLNKTVENLTVGGTSTLIASVLPITQSNQAVTWTSSNNAIVTVNNIGKVTAVGVGSGIISVTTSDGGKIASCTVSVTNISLNKTTDNLKVGGTDTLIASLFPIAPSNDTVKWATSNNAIANIDSNGKVTAVSTGTAIITATAIIVGGSYMATCKVIVTAKTNLTFAIDIGHNSAYDGGAVGIRAEDISNKEVGTRVMAKLINLGYNVVDTSPTNATSLTNSLQQRCDAANAANADYYVAIHFNMYNGAASGSEVYIFSDVNRTMAQEVLNNIVSLGYINRGVKYETYYVLRNTSMPAMLIECSFLDSVSDMNRYDADAFADAIVNGLTAGN